MDIHLEADSRVKRKADMNLESEESATNSTYNDELLLSPTHEGDSPSVFGRVSEELAERSPLKKARKSSSTPKNNPPSEDTSNDQTNITQKQDENEIPPVNLDNNHYPLTSPTVPQDQLAKTIRRQIEYYFSDENLKHDKFFRKVMEECPEGYENSLDMKTILNCPRLKKLNTNQDEILKALEGSSIIVKLDKSNQAWLSRSLPLPPFEEAPSRPRHQQKKTPIDQHLAGPLVTIKNIPEHVTSWITVKNSLQEALPKGTVIKFVTNLNGSGSCRLWVKNFPDFKKKLADFVVTIEGVTVEVEMMSNEQDIKHFINVEMPTRIRKQRERLIASERSRIVQLPLKISGQSFNSVEHLKKCVSELLQKTPEGSQLKSSSNAENVIIGLLDYHPNPQLKSIAQSDDFKHIKVISPSKKENLKYGKTFAIVRTLNKEDEDEMTFRIDKCLSELSRNPPFITPEKASDTSPEI